MLSQGISLKRSIKGILSPIHDAQLPIGPDFTSVAHNTLRYSAQGILHATSNAGQKCTRKVHIISTQPASPLLVTSPMMPDILSAFVEQGWRRLPPVIDGATSSLDSNQGPTKPPKPHYMMQQLHSCRILLSCCCPLNPTCRTWLDSNFIIGLQDTAMEIFKGQNCEEVEEIGYSVKEADSDEDEVNQDMTQLCCFLLDIYKHMQWKLQPPNTKPWSFRHVVGDGRLVTWSHTA